MQLSDYLSPEDVVIDLAFNSKKDMLARLADLASKRCKVPSSVIVHALRDREDLGSTGIGGGIAIPHAVVDGLERSVCMFVRLARPLDFEAVDEVPVDLIALLLSPPDVQRQSLNILSCIARCLRSEPLAAATRSAGTPEAIYVLLTTKPASNETMQSADLLAEAYTPVGIPE